jgi:hypothetical protein
LVCSTGEPVLGIWAVDCSPSSFGFADCSLSSFGFATCGPSSFSSAACSPSLFGIVTRQTVSVFKLDKREWVRGMTMLTRVSIYFLGGL